MLAKARHLGLVPWLATVPRPSAMTCIGPVPRPSACLIMVPRPCLETVPRSSAMTCLEKVPRPSSCLDTVLRPSAFLFTVPRHSAIPRNGASALCHDMPREGVLA